MLAEQAPLTHESFPEFVRTNKFALIHFFASWNGHDVEMKRIISGIPGQITAKVALGAIDTDPVEHHPLCLEHKVRNLPFLAFYRDGLLVRSTTGLLSDASLRQYLSEFVDGGV